MISSKFATVRQKNVTVRHNFVKKIVTKSISKTVNGKICSTTYQKNHEHLQTLWGVSGVKEFISCISQKNLKKLQTAPTLAIGGADTAENGPSKVRQVSNKIPRNIGLSWVCVCVWVAGWVGSSACFRTHYANIFAYAAQSSQRWEMRAEAPGCAASNTPCPTPR